MLGVGRGDHKPSVRTQHPGELGDVPRGEHAQHRVEAVVLDRQPTPHVRYDGGDPGVGLGRQAGRSLGDVQGDPDSRIVVAQSCV